MAHLLTRPLARVVETLSVPGGQNITIFPQTPWVWVRLVASSDGRPRGADRWMPAVIDTGYSGGLLTTARLLADWGQPSAAALTRYPHDELVGGIDGWSGKHPRFVAYPWVRGAPTDRNAHLLELTHGVTIAALSLPFPVLGVDALSASKLRLGLDFTTNSFSLFKTHRLFGDWSCDQSAGVVTSEMVAAALAEQARRRAAPQSPVNQLQMAAVALLRAAEAGRSPMHPHDLAIALGLITPQDRARHLDAAPADPHLLGALLKELNRGNTAVTTAVEWLVRSHEAHCRQHRLVTHPV